jgi:ABC-2 type transport system ATP-binding protein
MIQGARNSHKGRTDPPGSGQLISSHVMDEATECDSLLLMRDGALLEQITPGRLRKQTGKDDLGRAFLAVIEQAEQEAKTQSGTDG